MDSDDSAWDIFLIQSFLYFSRVGGKLDRLSVNRAMSCQKRKSRDGCCFPSRLLFR